MSGDGWQREQGKLTSGGQGGQNAIVKSCDAPYLEEGSFRTDPADLVLLVLHEPFLLESELFLFSPPNKAANMFHDMFRAALFRDDEILKCTGTDNKIVN